MSEQYTKEKIIPENITNKSIPCRGILYKPHFERDQNKEGQIRKREVGHRPKTMTYF